LEMPLGFFEQHLNNVLSSRMGETRVAVRNALSPSRDSDKAAKPDPSDPVGFDPSLLEMHLRNACKAMPHRRGGKEYDYLRL
jgi:hypothetical protein